MPGACKRRSRPWPTPPEWPGRRLVGRRGLRIALGALWLIDAALQAEPAKFHRDYPLHTLAQAVMGAPWWVNRSVFAGVRPFVAHWPWWNLAATVLQAAIGVALLSGRLVRPALVVSFAWALTIWWLGEAFGNLTSGFGLLASGAPGSVLLYGVLGALAWPRRARPAPEATSTARPDVDRRWWTAVWLVLWLGAIGLHLATPYPPGQVLTANLHDISDGQPRLLADTADWMTRIVAHHAGAVTTAMIVLEAAIAVVCVVDRPHPQWWLGLGIALSLFFWVVFQQLGGIFTSAATDPNSGPLLILTALAAWPRRHPLYLTGEIQSTI